jgi:cytochrome c
VRRILAILGLVLCVARLGLAHEGRIVDLKTVPPDHQVQAVTYCKGVYRLTLKDGSAAEFTEFNLRFKTDSGPNGPDPGAAVLVPAGMAGDRAFVVFAEPDAMKAFLKKTC